MQNPITLLTQFFRWIANIGITDTISFYEKKKTQLLNLAVACGAPINFYFAIKNFSEDRTTLAIINICLMTGEDHTSEKKFLIAVDEENGKSTRHQTDIDNGERGPVF